MKIVLIAAAVIPAVWLLVKIYQADRLEKEPAGLLVSLVILGVAATALAGFTEQLGDAWLDALFPRGGLVYEFLLYFGVVALAEEGFKYLLLKLRTWKSPHFNCSFDGVVYGVFVSLGFALWENIAYVLTYGFGTAVVRAITAVPGHACFGVFMGAWYGAAKRYEMIGNPEDAKRCRRTGLVTAILLHGIYDFTASLDSTVMGIVFLLFVSWMFTRAGNLVKQLSAEDAWLGVVSVSGGEEYHS